MPRPFLLPCVLLGTLAISASSCRTSGGNASRDGAADTTGAPSLPSEVQTARSVCTLRTDHLRPLAEVALSASGSTPPFATLLGATGGLGPGLIPLHAELGIPADDTMPFSLRLIGAAADIRVQVPRTFPVHPAVPLALSNFAGALPNTHLRVVRASDLEVEVEVDPDPVVEVIGPPLHARGQCSRFAIERRDFVASAVVPGVKWKESPDAQLKRGKKIPLTTLPIGEPVARLELGPTENAAVVVFEKEKDVDRAHIGWFGARVMMHGWVPTGDLQPIARQPPDEGMMGKLPAPPPPATGERLTCSAATPLVAQVGESRTTIGTLVAGSAFTVLARDKGWAEVRVELPLFALAAGSRLVVREADLAACKK